VLLSQRLGGNPQLQAAANNAPSLVSGSTGEGVKILQRALRDLGHDMTITFADGDADGDYGPETAAAVRAFQIDCDFGPSGQDGKAGRDTLHALDDVFVRSEVPMGLDDLKGRWFLDFSFPTSPFPPVSRYPGSSHAPHTDGNLVTPLIDGQNFMRAWHDTIRGMTGSPGSEVYHLSWMLNAVRTLGESVPASNALQVLSDAHAGGVVIDILLSAHLLSRPVNEGSRNTLAGAGVNNVFIDGRFPTLGSAHQKVSVLKKPEANDVRAMLGSIDINTTRWDRMAHDPIDPERGVLVPGGTMSGGGSGGSSGVGGTQGPTHDLGVEVRGPAVADVERTFRDRWLDPTMTPPLPPLSSGLSSPAPLGPQSVQVLHTYGITASPPGYSWAPTGDFTTWASYLNAIQQARRYIYIEDQYFIPFAFPPLFAGPAGTARDSDIYFQLGEAIKRGVKVVVLVPSNAEDPFPAGPVINHQRQLGVNFLASVAASSPGDFIIASLANGATPVYVHAKLMLVDDELALVGTANVNQRSMANDSEIHLAVVESEGTFAHELRKALWQHHLEVPGRVLEHYFTACAVFKRQVAAGGGRVRPFSTAAPGAPPFGHEQIIAALDPYSGPPR
jgi:phosphatidylserine/phosphatidylglycerophosphate/cardiolipin synthase-like enzyme